MIAREDSPAVQMSVVVPVYGCADCLHALHARLSASIATITDDYELVFVDDRSEDGAWSVLVGLADSDVHVRALRLSRNFGQDAAITAGLAHARGAWAIVMDCDLQEAPEDIPRLWAAAAAGPHDIVRTARRDWSHGALRRLTSRAYRALTVRGADSPSYSNLSLLSRPVIDAFLRLRDRDREYAIALDWLGYSSTTVEIQHHPRHAGRSSYTWGRLVRVAFDGAFFRSTALLRMVVGTGFLVALGGLLLAAFEIVEYLDGRNRQVPGYTSLAVLLLVLAGVIIISVGVVGLYVGRIFEQVKDRPLYLIDARTDEPPDATSGAFPLTQERPILHPPEGRTPSRGRRES